jgi:hypothetical protein
MNRSNLPPGCSPAELHRHNDVPDEIRCEGCDIGDPDELIEFVGSTGGAFYLCEEHARKRGLTGLRKKAGSEVEQEKLYGRWYRCGGGVGLEVSEDAKAEDDFWSPIGDIEFPDGRIRKYVVRVGREEGHIIGRCSSEGEARRKLVTAIGCEMISNMEAA